MEMYWKNIIDGYITAIGEGKSDNPITEEEYNEIMEAVRSRPVSPDGYDYRLREDMTWELFELPPEDPDPELTDAELIAVLTGEAE